MDSYYSPPSYYYQPPCPLHDSYPTHYYPSYVDQSPPQQYIYHQPSPTLNTTFELGMIAFSMTEFF